MSRFLFLLLLSLCGSAVAVALGVSVSSQISFSDVRALAASVFFVDSVTVDELAAKYSSASRGGKKVKVLIVPGHDNDSWGTEFQGVREADMTAAVGEELARILSADPHLLPVLVRTKDGYAKEFTDYFANESVAVKAFVANRRQIMKDLMKESMVLREQGVIHNSAPSAAVGKLYSFNKWANENGVDIVLHLHFNDYPGRGYGRQGRYDGFAFYVPEKQFSNARASRAVADALLAQFSRFYAESNFPLEKGGIVLDQDLIAVGAYNTLDAVGILIEYGYIYEERFRDETIRNAFLKELAFQTYLGLNRFFGSPRAETRPYPTTFLPHAFDAPLSRGAVARPSVLSLQAALLFEEVYPPEDDKRACPLTGSFGPCTARATRRFQEKYGIAPATGVAGELTLQKLNEKYSR